MLRIRSPSALAICAIIIFFLFWFLHPITLLNFSSLDGSMTVKHLVLFRFKADASSEAVREASSRMLGLKDGCVHPTSQKQYIKSLTGGKDNSIEGA
ncbi:hypothetical protein F5Y04DRAFT_12492 [Hypomontagnella monticulosa]|nr:hypothetical protein F5Y04DRAFT_12492 [Hypomontagnella monticulosa]